MPHLLVWISYPALLVGTGGMAWAWGADAERWGALLILVANLAAEAMLAACYPHFPSLSMCAVDFILAAGLLGVAVRFASLWLGVAMLLQSVTLGLQALSLSDGGPSASLVYGVNDAVSYSMVACILAATLASRRNPRDRSRGGPAKPVVDLPVVAG